MANLFTPAIKALKEWQKGLPERQKNRNWGRTESYAEQCKLLPSVEAVAKLEDAEQVKALKELCEALPKGKGRSSAVCSPAFLTEWINKLGVALMGQLPEETLMNESFKMVLVLEDVVMETAQSWQGGG